MIALLASEVRRLHSRRLFRVLVGLAVLAITVGAIIVAVRSKDVVGTPIVDHRFHLTLLAATLEGLSPILIIVSWVLGASFIGADWHAGSLTTLMTWDPRRVRVMAAKVVACVGVSFVFALAVQALLGGALALAATFRGTTIGVDAAWVGETVGIALRVAALSAIGASIGFALASVARNTAAALGVGFGYTVIVENLIRGLRPQWQQWLLGDNAVVFITGQGADASFHRSMLLAGLFIATCAVLALSVAISVFRVRDVH